MAVRTRDGTRLVREERRRRSPAARSASAAFAHDGHQPVLRADESGVTVSGGPYEATNEPFGAFFIVEADSIDEAVEIAKLHPGTHLGHMIKGGIEVRPIDQVEQVCPAKQGE